MRYLRIRHPKEVQEHENSVGLLSLQNPETSGTAQLHQTTITSFASPTPNQQWASDHPRAKAIHAAIGKMIGIDLQPYSIVGDTGFNELLILHEPQYKIPSMRFFADKIIAEMHESITSRIQAHVAEAQAFAFTSNIWTCEYTTQFYISVTSHWIDDDFQRTHAILRCEAFDGRHTTLNIYFTFMHLADASIQSDFQERALQKSIDH